MGLLNPGGPIAQFKRNRCSISPVELILQSGVRSTGQSILLSGSGRDKKYGYRNGIQTDLGDIRNDVWRDLVRELIVRSHEEDLFDKLLEWEKEHTYWLKTKAELEHYTLELYAARIFDNPKWVDYEAFAKHYGYQPQSYEG